MSRQGPGRWRRAGAAGRRTGATCIAVVLTLAPVILPGCNGEFPTDPAQYHAAEAAYDSAKLYRSLNDIETWHAAHNTGLVGSLRKGISVSSIEAAFSREECRPTEELKALWSWRNGEDSPVPFVWYHDFLSMEEARSEYVWLRLNPLVGWDSNYLPVFSFEGEWYAVYCGPEGRKAGPVVHFFLEDEPEVAYINLTTFLITMAETLTTGAVLWKEDAMVDDIGNIYRIHQKHNKGFSFPYYVPEDS